MKLIPDMVAGMCAIFCKAIMGFCIPGWKWYWRFDLSCAACPYFWCILCVILKIRDNSVAMISRSATLVQINAKGLCLTVDICFTGMNQPNVINRNAITDRLTPQLDIRCPVDVTTDLQKTILSACNPLFLSCGIIYLYERVCVVTVSTGHRQKSDLAAHYLYIPSLNNHRYMYLFQNKYEDKT